jgi:hypothetical protein
MDENKKLYLELHTLFEYKEGKLYWKVNRQGVKEGKEAGCKRRNNYVVITVNQKPYPAHRLIFLFHHGYLPEMVDHIDRNPNNNNILNLRASTRHENQYNVTANIRNTSGVKNVCWHKAKQRWMVKIKAGGKFHYLGYYLDIESAKLKAQEAREMLHKEFARG